MKGEGQHPSESAEELYQNAPCGYVSFLNDGSIFNINNTLLTWLGYKREEVVYNLRFQQFLKPGGQIYFETHFFPLIKMQGFVNEINFDFLRKDRTLLPCLLNVTQVPSEGTSENTYRASIFNITDRKNYERELIQERKKAEEASKAKAAFLAMISHEIRTPLNAILGIGNLFHKTTLDAQQQEYARVLLNSSENLLGLVNNLLDMSKIESGKVKLEKIPFSLIDIIEVLRSTFQEKCQEKGIELQILLPENLPEQLLGDPFKLTQVLTNLLGNAIKFTRKGYVKLEIALLHRSQNQISFHFAVSDTGIGIPATKLRSVFDEFSQASYDVGLKYGGTGLGLTISQRLLKLHGSEMTLESEEGRGSIFSFELTYELDRNASKEKKRGPEQLKQEQLDPAHILVVDDNRLNIFIIKEYLSGWNLSFHAVENGMEALEAVKGTHYDLVLMDLQMPLMNGYEAARSIRELDLDRQPVIIALSATATGVITNKLKAAGIDHHVPKPFSPSELFDKLSHHLKIRTSARRTEVPSALPPTASIDISRFYKMANNNTEFMVRALESTLAAFISYQEKLHPIIKARDPKALAALTHQMSMSLYYVQAERLSALLEEYQELLERSTMAPEDLARQETSIDQEFNKIIAELRLLKEA